MKKLIKVREGVIAVVDIVVNTSHVVQSLVNAGLSMTKANEKAREISKTENYVTGPDFASLAPPFSEIQVGGYIGNVTFVQPEYTAKALTLAFGEIQAMSKAIVEASVVSLPMDAALEHLADYINEQ